MVNEARLFGNIPMLFQRTQHFAVLNTLKFLNIRKEEIKIQFPCLVLLTP